MNKSENMSYGGRGGSSSKTGELGVGRWSVRRGTRSVVEKEGTFSSWAQATCLKVGQVIVARELPLVQGIVLGRSNATESLRVLIASYTARNTQYRACITDIPFFFLPSQSLVPDFVFQELARVVDRVQQGAGNKGFRKSQEEDLLQWVGNGCLGESEELENHSEESRDEEGESGSEEVMTKMPAGEGSRDGDDSQASGVTSAQFAELTKLVAEVVKCQQQYAERDRAPGGPTSGREIDKGPDCRASREEAEWGDLTERVEKLKLEKEGRREDAGARRKNKRQEPVEEEDVEVSDEEVEWLDCPFKRKGRRFMSYRVSPTQRRLIRRLLEEIYGGYETAVQAAHSMLGNYEVDGRALGWEEAQMVNYARALDVVLLGSSGGVWSTWNEGAVDLLAKSFFEMVARVKPGQEVIEFMEPEWQKKIKEMSFGKNRSLGPLSGKVGRGAGPDKGRGQGVGGWWGKNYQGGEGTESYWGRNLGGGGWGGRGSQGGDGGEGYYGGRGYWRTPRMDNSMSQAPQGQESGMITVHPPPTQLPMQPVVNQGQGPQQAVANQGWVAQPGRGAWGNFGGVAGGRGWG